MVELKKHIPKPILKSIKSIKEEKILLEVKKRYLEQVAGRLGGKSYLKECGTLEKISGDNIIDSLAKSFSLSKVYYIIANFFTCARSHFILECEKYDLDDFKTKLLNLENENGQPIWENDISTSPTLWNIFSEHDKNHYYITYLHSNPKTTFFDPIIHEFSSYKPTGIINFRIHIDHSVFIEVFTRESTIDNITKSFSSLNKKLNLNDINFLEITQENLENFDRLVKMVSHEVREGEETTIYLTRVNDTKDTRNEIMRADYALDDREFRKEHGIIEVNKEDYNVGLIRGKKGRIRIMRHLPPQEQISVMHEVFKILEWTP